MHLALFYRDGDEYADGVLRFVGPALAAKEPVAIAVPGPRAGLLRDRLGDFADDVELFDMVELGRNPARIIPAVEQMLARRQGRLLHYVGEPIWPGRSPAEIREATRHEALINLAWAGAHIRVLCPYDTVALPDDVLADAERTHPRLIRDGHESSSPAYGGPDVPVGCEGPLPDPPTDAAAMLFTLGSLFDVRTLVREHAVRASLAPDRVSDLVLAVNELATNAVRHGDGTGMVQVWRVPHDLICQISDRGQITDPLAGRRSPAPDAAGGLGLFTVNQVCDLAEVRSGPAGTTVRIHATLN